MHNALIHEFSLVSLLLSLIVIKFNPTKKKIANNVEECELPFAAIL